LKIPRRCRPVGVALLMCCCYGASLAHTTTTPFFQERIVKGRVTSKDDELGFPGVNILVKGTTVGTVTDAEGNYSLSVPSNDAILVFSSIGYKTTEIPVGTRTTIDLAIENDITTLSEVVVVGYGVQEKRDVTGSISSLGAEALSKVANTNALEGMKGQIAGVDVLQSNGRPGSNPTITIRGRRSINASNDPLFVIDGVPMTSGTSTGTDTENANRTPVLPGGTPVNSGSNPLNDFNPADIQSIEVLKDAAATAIYGSRGANGVVLITTKRGKSGKTTVSYNGYYGVTQPFSTFPMMNGQEFADLKREAYRLNSQGKIARDAWNGTISPDNVVFGGQPVELKSVEEGRSTDWQDLIFKNGSQVNHQVSVNGGNDKTQFNMSLGYFKQGGTIEGMDFTKITARINVDQQISKRFKVGMSNQLTHSIQNSGSPAVMSEAVNQSPLGVPYDDAGNLIFLPISDAIRSNPLNELVPGKMIDEEKIDRIFSSAYLEADIIKGLKYKFLLGVDLRYTTRGIFEGRFTNSRKNGDPAAQYQGQANLGYTMENLLTYNKVLNEKHNIGLTFLQSVQESNYENKYTSVSGLPYETQKWYNLNTASTIIANRSRFEHWALASFMGRINYTFAGKYMLQATMRADGSSRLAPGNKWTTFPGLSAGWRIKEENFMSNINVVSDLKLRGSYGMVGNTSIDPYKTQGVLQRTVYSWDEANAAGFGLSELPNANLGWEKNETVDLGLDFGLFNGRLNGTFDVYQTNTTDLLLKRNLPPSSGYDFILQNVGATRTRGFEVTLNGNIISTPSGFKWDADFNVASYKEEIVDLALRDANGNPTNDTGNAWFLGQPIRVFFDYKKIGIWQADEADLAKTMMNAYPGEIKLQDTNNDGMISPADRVVLGSDIPKAYGGLNNRFSFKGFDFSFFLYYRLGYMLDSRFHSDQATMQSRYNNLKVDYWTIDNPTNDYPRPNFNQENPVNNTVLRYKDGGFVKLRTITLGYTLPRSICDRLMVSSLRVYVSAQNPKVWSSYKVFDPESVDRIDASDIPSNKLFLGGINLTF
jgi:TonB-linked SusC/RagA family outer membrane protein